MRTPAPSPPWRVLLAIAVTLSVMTVVVIVLVTGRGSGAPSGQRLSYVALGDSYTSAPYVPPQTEGDPCLRSGANYPHLLAERLPALTLTDVSCGGATTVNMTEPQTLGTDRLPAQFDALGEDTDLVTLGIGGNDFSLFGSLIYACFPGVASGGTCHGASPRGAELQVLVDLIQANVAGVLDDIAERAPDAHVVVVPYPQILTPTSSCPDRVPFGADDATYISDVMSRLSGALSAAAEDAGVDSVDVLTASEGHDICAEEPWVMGSATDVEVAASFHPRPEQQEAVADLLAERLCESVVDC